MKVMSLWHTPHACTRTPTSAAAGGSSTTSSMPRGSWNRWQTAARTGLSNNARAVTARTRVRTGGHVVVETLEALGATAVFGLPGIHALPIWEALRESSLRTYGLRTELNAGFAAGGWAHVTGRAAPLVVSTG